MDALKASHDSSRIPWCVLKLQFFESMRIASQHDITTAAFDHSMMQQQRSNSEVHLLHDMESLVRGELGIDVLSVDGLHSNIQLAHLGLVHLQICPQRCD